jgi:hypothetical protein
MHGREIINGFLFVLCVDLALMIAYFMLYTYRTVGADWRKADGMPTACALAWVFGILGLRCFLVWFVLWCNNRDIQLPQWFDILGSYAMIVSAFALAVVTLRATFIFTPPEWGNAPWLASVLAAAMFTLVALAI